MENKIILVTGATDGIGKITATNLAKMGCTVIIHGRNENKAIQTVKEIKNQTGNDNITYLIADLLQSAQIKSMVEVFNQHYDHLDVLINNAGAVLNDKRTETNDGIESTMQLNVIAPFLLTQLLLPSLKKSNDGRIINMSSGTYRTAKPDMSDLNLKNEPSGQKRYAITKLFTIWNTQSLAKELANSGINNLTVNVSHPGAVATNFGQDSDNGFINNLIYKLALYVMPAPEKGAITNTYLATSDNVKGITGKFFNNKKKIIKVNNKNYTPKNASKLWDYCMKTIKPYLVR